MTIGVTIGRNRIEQLIRTIPDLPEPGIRFHRITRPWANTDGFRQAIRAFADRRAPRLRGPRLVRAHRE